MRLKKRTKFINYAVEGSPNKRHYIKSNVSRFFYLLLLAVIVFIILFNVFNRALYIKGDGLLTFTPFTIRATRDVILDSLFVSEGEFVGKGQKLLIKRSLDGNSSELTPTDQILDQTVKIDRDIQLKYAEIRYLNGLNEILAQQNQSDYDLIALELVDNRGSDDNSDLKINNTKIAKLKQEIGILKNYKSNLTSNNDHPVSASHYVSVDEFVSPIKGEVVEIYKVENEMAKKGDPIISLSSLDDMRIKGYFEQKFIKYISVGKIVNIEFPHGVKSKGVVKNFYFSTIPLPPEFQKKYEPTRRTIIVDIYPLEGEKEKWAKFHMLSVELTIPRN